MGLKIANKGVLYPDLVILELFFFRDSILVMAAILAGNNVEQEYLWSCSLTGSNKEFKWAPEDPAENESHRLLIKSAILMPTAKKDEVTVVQIESEGYKQEKLTVPICAMRGGVDLQTYVDLLVPCPAKISLLQGEGPIHLSGSHCVDYDGYKEVDDDGGDHEVTEDEEAAEMEAMEEASEEKKVTPIKEGSESVKRKSSSDPPKSDEKQKKESPAKL